MCAVALFVSCERDEMKAPPEPKPYSAPPFSLTDLSGKAVSLADYKGKPLIINFWATWCPPCKAEMPELQRARDARKDAGLEVLAINFKEKPETAADFVRKNGYSMAFLLDELGVAGKDYQVFGLPTSYFVDRSGTIRHTYHGDMTREIINDGLKKISVEEY